MKTNAKVSFGIAALVAAGTFGFAPASADKGMQAASVTVTMVAPVLASPETPQDAVWDMTYGAERPILSEDPAAQPESPIVDYTFG